MPGNIIITSMPNAVVQAYMQGKRLILPGALAALTWQVPYCSLDHLMAEQTQTTWVTDAHARLILGALPIRHETPFQQHSDDRLLVAVRAVLKAGLPEGERPGEPLVDLAAAYVQGLTCAGLWDAAQAPVNRPTTRQSLLVHGYHTLTPGQASWLTELADETSLIILPESEPQPETSNLNETLRQLGWHSLSGPPAASPAFQYLAAADPLHEARTALALASQHVSSSTTPQRILITARQPEEYRAALTLAARERSVTLQWFGTGTHADTPAGRFLMLIARVLSGGWAYEPTCALLGSAFVDELTPPHWKRIQQAGAATQERWSTLGLFPKNLAFLCHLPQTASVTGWYDVLKEASLAANLLFELTPVLKTKVPLNSDQRTYGAALQQVLRLPATQSHGWPEHEILIASAERLPGAQVDLVLALGLVERVWPSPPDFQAPLDVQTRSALEKTGIVLPTAVSHVQQEGFFFWWAQRAAPKFFGLRPQVINGSPRPPSDLINGAPCAAAPAYEAGVVSAPGREPPAPFQFQGAPFDLFETQFSPTQLTRFGQCAFRWFAQHGLRLKDPEEPQATLAAHVRGRLYHSTLDHVAKQLSSDPSCDRAELVAEGFKYAETEEQLNRLPGWRWQRTEQLQHLHRLVNSSEFLPEGQRIHTSEHNFVIDWNGLTVSGTLDRLDETSTGFEVTDYKTGASKPKGAKGADGRLSLDVQLPIYLAAATALLQQPVTQGRYVSMTKHDKRILAAARPDQDALNQLAGDVANALEFGQFPINPDVAREACAYCPCQVLCRDEGEVGDDHVD